MKLKSLSMTNWKCYKFKTVLFEDKMNFYNQRNGFGKSSIFEAIIYAMYGVMPANTNQLKNKIEDPIIIELILEDESGNTIGVKRETISATSKKLFYKRPLETEWTAVSSKQMDEFISSFAGTKDLFPLIWSKEPIYTSSVLSIDYIKDKVFAKDFEEADTIAKRVREDRGYNLKREKSILGHIENRIDSIDEEIEQIKREISELETSLKETPYKKSGLLDKAIAVLEARERFIRDFSGYTPVDKPSISRYEYLKMREDRNQATIKNFIPKNKELESLISKFNKQYVNSILEENYNDGRCPICGGDYSIEHEFGMGLTDVFDMLNSRTTLVDFEEAKREIEELSAYSPDDILKSKEYYKVEELADSLPNPEEIIEQDKKVNDQLWIDYNEKKKILAELERIKEFVSEYIAIQDIKKKDSDIIAAIETWKNEKTNNMISFVLNKATDIMSRIDQKYMRVYYSLEDKCFQVVICEDDQIKVLAHSLLSAGERSVLALALTLSYRTLVAKKNHIPGFFMLDESLSALDKDHLEKAIEVLNDEEIQTLLINHS